LLGQDYADEKAFLEYNNYSKTGDLDVVVPRLNELHGNIPETWRPIYAAFIRLGNGDFSVGTNHTFPIALRAASPGQRQQMVWKTFLKFRQDYVARLCPHVYEAEVNILPTDHLSSNTSTRRTQ